MYLFYRNVFNFFRNKNYESSVNAIVIPFGNFLFSVSYIGYVFYHNSEPLMEMEKKEL